MKAKVAVFGAYTIGMTIQCEKFPVGGETVPGHNFQMLHGGKGSNQAVAASRMGAEVLFGTCVGNDSFGDMCMQLYEQEQMDSSHIIRSRKGNPTGCAPVIVDAKGENEIVIQQDDAKEYSAADVDELLEELKECQVCLMPLEMTVETALHIARRCRELGVKFILNPAPYAKLPEELYGLCDYITPNQTEARQMAGEPADSPMPDEEIGKKIRRMGVKHVVMTLGNGGALCVTEEGTKVIPGVRVDAVDTTGAGDTFSGSFAVAIAEGKSLEEAIHFANAAAALSVTKYGVIEAIPRREETEKML